MNHSLAHLKQKEKRHVPPGYEKNHAWRNTITPHDHIIYCWHVIPPFFCLCHGLGTGKWFPLPCTIFLMLFGQFRSNLGSFRVISFVVSLSGILFLHPSQWASANVIVHVWDLIWEQNTATEATRNSLLLQALTIVQDPQMRNRIPFCLSWKLYKRSKET